MRKIYLSVFMVLSIIFITTSCSSSNSVTKILKTIGIDLSSGTISQSMNSHGGFHGDGTTYIEIEFSDSEGEAVTKVLDKNKAWNKIPLTDNLNIAIYGKENPSESIGPLVTNEDGKAFFPIVENGYYFFIDRHSESKFVKNDTDLLKRNSFNFTLAIYDTDNQKLYYCELDT